jgi:phenylacetate-coenzyme A ligase PaaK-like adenylate-forming protein
MIDRRLLWRQVAATARFTRDLPSYVARPTDAVTAAERVRDRLAHREQRLLESLRRTVFGNPASPYLGLLRHVGCDYRDVVDLMAREGPDGCMARLASLGVYVTQAEFKGRADIVRGSFRIRCSPRDFENPACRPHFVVPTSGSTGTQAFVGRTLEEQAETGEVMAMALASYGVFNPTVVTWQTLPHAIFQDVLAGMPVIGWLNSVAEVPAAVKLLQAWVWAATRLAGARLAWPRCMPIAEPERMLNWLAPMLPAHRALLIPAVTSAAARVCSLAVERGISLDRVLWRTWGEPLTAARARTIHESGARALCSYSITETGSIGTGCGRQSGEGAEPDRVHLRTDRFVIIQRAGDTILGPIERGRLAVTSIGDTMATVMLNLETGDSARVLDDSCDCEMSRAGLTLRIADIRSFEKLTGEGVTVIGDELVSFVEQELPRQFGGKSGDYQLAEVEAVNAATKLTIRVRPSVGPIDEEALKRSLLAAIAAHSVTTRHMAETLRSADAIRVSREPPWETPSGKLPAFVPLRATATTRV